MVGILKALLITFEQVLNSVDIVVVILLRNWTSGELFENLLTWIEYFDKLLGGLKRPSFVNTLKKI